MTELELYKFLNEGYGVQEYRWEGDEFLVWIRFDGLEDFTKMVGYNYLSDGGIDCNLRDDCICINIVDIAEYHDIDLEDILEKEVKV